MRIAVGCAVVAAHLAFGGLIFMSSINEPQAPQPEAIMVSVIDAPLPEQVRAAVAPERAQPAVAPPPEPVVESPPEPDPVIEPDPEPVLHQPPEPKPEPRPKPKIKPFPKPQAPVRAPPAPAPAQPLSIVPPAGNPAGGLRNQAPVSSDPILISTVEYRGAQPVAVYPLASRRIREQGRVSILVEIDTAGDVRQASVDKSSGFSRLDEAALTAARKARFKPLMRNGVAILAKAKLPFDFVMRN